jgi:hypothetical protein
VFFVGAPEHNKRNGALNPLLVGRRVVVSLGKPLKQRHVRCNHLFEVYPRLLVSHGLALQKFEGIGRIPQVDLGQAPGGLLVLKKVARPTGRVLGVERKLIVPLFLPSFYRVPFLLCRMLSDVCVSGLKFEVFRHNINFLLLTFIVSGTWASVSKGPGFPLARFGEPCLLTPTSKSCYGGGLRAGDQRVLEW